MKVNALQFSLYFLFTNERVHSFTVQPVHHSLKRHHIMRNAQQSLTRQMMSKDDETATSGSTNRRNFIKTTTAATTAIVTSSATSLPTPTAAVEMTGTSTTSLILSEAGSISSTPIQLPKMGLGAWAWGDSVFWGYNPKQDDDLHQVFDYALSKDLAFFDTAEIYGFGRSEKLLGDFRSQASSSDESDKVQIATKFAAFPFRTKPKDVVQACRASLKRLNPNSSIEKPIDLYQIHFPNAWSNEEYWDGLAQCYELGLVKSVGVSNYGVDALRATHSKLAERGIPLATNQIQLSLLYRFPIENGLLETCNELGVKVLSYSPLALGFLTGKYDKNNFPTGPRQNIAKTIFEGDDNGESFTSMLQVMKEISSNHGGVPLSQVALNWTRSKGTIPIPGARSLKQATQNIGALDWDLTENEVLALDVASSKVPAYITPDKSPFPKEDINTKLKMFDS